MLNLQSMMLGMNKSRSDVDCKVLLNDAEPAQDAEQSHDADLNG